MKKENLKRTLRKVKGAQDRTIVLEGKELLNFCSNNYLGLANDKRLLKAAQESMKTEGFGAGASRLVCGNMAAHQELEEKMCQFKKSEGCLVFSSGYMANIGIISALFSKDDIIFSDRLNHASIVDGIKLSGAKFKRYPHSDMKALEKMLKEFKEIKRKVIITDSIFSMDGDIAPLDEIVRLAKKYKSLVMIDEAHALGVIGKNGRGLAEHFDVEKDIDIQMGTFSKAVGSFGAYCCGKKELMDELINKARSFIYTTGLPPAVCAASSKGIDIIQQEEALRKKLWDNTYFIRGELTSAGFDTQYSQTPIIPIVVKDSDLALEFSKRLVKEGVFISAIRPPTVPNNTARMRLSITAKHTKDDCEKVVEVLKKVGGELKIIN